MAKSRFVLATFALAALVACADAGGDTTQTEGTNQTTSPKVAPNASAPSALQFSAPAVGGGTIDFTQFAGAPVVLWFWAPT